MTKKLQLNGTTKWLILAVTIIFSSGILWNKVNNLEKDVTEVKNDLKSLTAFIMVN